MSLSITPIGQGESLSEPIARVVDTIKNSGSNYELGSMWTSVEGDWEDCLKILDQCRQTLDDQPRLEIHVKFDLRQNGREHSLSQKKASVQ